MLIKKPWGEFKQLSFNQTCTVKLITVSPNCKTSLHYHNLRDDMWVILDDGLQVQIGDDVFDASVGDEFVVPAEKVHRIISKGQKGRVLEVAFGYTEEEDDYRFEDDYGRPLKCNTRKMSHEKK